MPEALQFTAYIPTFLNQFNPSNVLVAQSSASQTLSAEAVTGLQIGSGVSKGARFYLTGSQAAQLSSALCPCYEGWYRIVLVDAGATAANIQYGAIGGVCTVAKGQSTVTDAANLLNLGIAPVVFLGTVTPGQYTIVQDLGEGESALLVAVSQTVSVGSVLVSTATGPVAVAGAISDTVYSTIVGIAEAAVTTQGSLTLTAVAAASGGTAVYTGTITSGAANAWKGAVVVIASFSNAANNGTFVCTASTATTLTLTNSAAVAETHAGTAAVQVPTRSRLGAPFVIL